MASSVNPDFITTAPVSKTGMKAQLVIVRDEITALQEDVGTVGVNFLQTGTGAVSRQWTPKLAEVGLFAGDFGADFSGVLDTQTALQNLFNAAASQGKFAIIPEGTYRVNGALTLPAGAAGLIMRGKIQYYGTGTALTIGGSGGTERAQFKWFEGINIERNTITDWSSESDIGLLARNLDNCYLEVKRISGFTIGLRTLGQAAGSGTGQAHGFEDVQIWIGQIVNCRYGIDVRTNGQYSWNNSVRYFGGHFTNSSTTNTGLSRFGVRFSREDITSYNLHNQHSFYAPAFELQRRNTDGSNLREAIPFLVEIAGRGIQAHDIRAEACSQIIARHTANAQDCKYNVIYVGSWGYNLYVDYGSGVTRGLGTINVTHQMGGVEEAQRLIAWCESAREAAFYDEEIESNGIAFEKMAILQGSAAGSTMDTMILTGGRDSFDLAADEIGVPGSYALGFVVDASQCQEFVLAIGGTALQLVVAQWDASQNELGSGAAPIFANTGCTYNASAKWWSAGSNFDATLAVTYEAAQKYYEHQRIRLHPNTRYAFIGVFGEGTYPGTTGRLRALRLYTPARALSPRWLYGGQYKWGSRVRRSTFAIDFPNVAAGASNSQNVTIVGLRAGDQVIVTPQSATTLQFFGVVGASNTLSVRFVNFTGGALDLASINFAVEITKRRA